MSVQSLREWKSRVSKWRGWAVAPSGTKGPNFWINLAFENSPSKLCTYCSTIDSSQMYRKLIWERDAMDDGRWLARSGWEVAPLVEEKLEQLLRVQSRQWQQLGETHWNWAQSWNALVSLLSGVALCTVCTLHSTTVIAQTLWKREQSSDRRNRFMLSHCTLFIKSSCHDDMTWEKSM